MDRILIVDDEFLIRYTLEEGLKDRGYDAYSAATVEEGLEFVRKYHPGVLLLDNLLENSVGMDEIVNFKNADEELQVIHRLRWRKTRTEEFLHPYQSYSYRSSHLNHCLNRHKTWFIPPFLSSHISFLRLSVSSVCFQQLSETMFKMRRFLYVPLVFLLLLIFYLTFMYFSIIILIFFKII